MRLLRELPPNKAAGPDGIPSQLLKAITIQQVVDLAALFTTLANDLDYRPNTRPTEWNNTLAMLLPKEHAAQSLDRHRAISLMSQVQKLYSKWLLAQMTPIIDPMISEHQAGFRRHRQASEILQVISKLIELSLEWQQPLTIVRLDMRKAFDRVKQSTILETLESTRLPPKIIFNAARELVGCYMFPTAYGCTPEDPVPLQQGTKQGAPESGLYFVATLNHVLAPLRQTWDDRKEGCPLGPTQIHHLIFADDLLLIGPSPIRIKTMFNEAKLALQTAGLEINDDKTAFLTTHPASAHHLPGINANETGMKILGRTFKLMDNTPQDMDAKIGIAWSKFNRLRHILRAETPLPHRLRIFKSCVGQALLWASETWHLTRRRLQRIRGIELSMMKTLIKCPRLPPEATSQERYAAHKAHIRYTLKTQKYEHLDRVWARRYYSWAGHLARLPPNRLAKQALLTQNLAWWRQQQRNPEGHRHTRRRGNISRWENALGRHHPKHELWQDTAQFRDRWNLYYPTFEKRLFGTHCPHDFSNVTEHNPDGPSPERQATQEEKPTHPPPKGRLGKPHPRDRERSPPNNPRPPKNRKKDESCHRSASSSQGMTPTQIARKWERELDMPLLSLAPPKDVRGRRARLGIRFGGGRGHCAHTSVSEDISQNGGRNKALSSEAPSSASWHTKRRTGRSGDRRAEARVQSHGRRRVRETTARSGNHLAKTSQGPRRAPLRRPARSTSSSTSSSSSTPLKGPEQRKRKEQEQRQEQSPGCADTPIYRADAWPPRVLAATTATAAAAANERAEHQGWQATLRDDWKGRKHDERNDRNEGKECSHDERPNDDERQPAQRSDRRNERNEHDERSWTSDERTRNEKRERPGRKHDERNDEGTSGRNGTSEQPMDEQQQQQQQQQQPSQPRNSHGMAHDDCDKPIRALLRRPDMASRCLQRRAALD